MRSVNHFAGKRAYSQWEKFWRASAAADAAFARDLERKYFSSRETERVHRALSRILVSLSLYSGV
jgi:hypothetical protein